MDRQCLRCGKAFKLSSRSAAARGQGIFCSRRCFGGWRSGHAHGAYHTGNRKGGKRVDLGDLYVRSSWEANWARYLNWIQSRGRITKWEYEADTFEFPVKRVTRFYTPDFKVWTDESHFYYDEVKGYMNPKSQTQLKRMARHYPTVEIRLVDRDQYTAVARQMSTVIPTWERTRVSEPGRGRSWRMQQALPGTT